MQELHPSWPSAPRWTMPPWEWRRWWLRPWGESTTSLPWPTAGLSEGWAYQHHWPLDWPIWSVGKLHERNPLQAWTSGKIVQRTTNKGPIFIKAYLVLCEDENNEVESDGDPVHTSYPAEDEEAYEGDEELECVVSVSTPEWRWCLRVPSSSPVKVKTTCFILVYSIVTKYFFVVLFFFFFTWGQGSRGSRGNQNVNKRMKRNQLLKTNEYCSKFCHLGPDHFPTGIKNGTSSLAHEQIVASCSHMKYEETRTRTKKVCLRRRHEWKKMLNHKFQLKKMNYFFRQVRVFKLVFWYFGLIQWLSTVHLFSDLRLLRMTG